MNYNIYYVYDYDASRNKVLLGAEIYGESFKKAIYIGIPFTLEDLSNTSYQRLLQIENMTMFQKKYQSLSPKGIIYFPQAENYAFLEEGEEVILWNGNDNIEQLLSVALTKYKGMIKGDNKKKKDEERQKIMPQLDAEDSLLELYDGIKLCRTSKR